MNTSHEFQFYLASQSPRRIEILQNLGFKFKLLSIEIDETPFINEDAVEYVQRLAIAKAQTAILSSVSISEKPVLAADTAVVINGEILGKPKDIHHAASMLKLLSGHQHQVYTAVCVALSQEDCKSIISVSIIDFAELSTADILAYCKTGESLGKAGAYAIQGLAAAFIKKMEGSYSGVMGLPIYETVQLLKDYGINLFNESKI